MDKSHASAFEYLEQTKEVLLSNLAERDPVYIASRKNNKWSPIEQCYHVYLAEKLSRKYCVKKLSYQPELQDAGLKTRFRIWALKTIELTPIKFKAPKAINDQVFPENLNLELVLQEWSKERGELNDFLETLNPSYVDKEIYRQPFVGRLTIGGMLNFFEFHQDRHRNHIKRNYDIG